MSKAVLPTVALGKPSGRWRVKRLVTLILFIILVVWAMSPLGQRLEQGWELDRLRRQMSAAKTEEARLRREIEQLQSDNEYIEMMIRKNLGMIKPGEERYIIIEPQASDSKQTDSRFPRHDSQK